MPVGIASIRNAAARPSRVDSTDPISVIQWTSHWPWAKRVVAIIQTLRSQCMKNAEYDSL
jgi:hypothetical protein